MAEKETNIICSLPEDLLLYILSSLPFKEAAKTCILSKKWLKMWQSINTVENNKLEWKNEETLGAVEVAQRKAFKNFIKIWITLHKQHHLHHKFTLKVYPPSNCGDIVEACIDFAVAAGVKDLELDFLEDSEEYLCHPSVEIPRLVYENKKLQQKLESLALHWCSFVPGNLGKFEALNDVTLAWIELKMESVRTLLSTCKWMESLSLKFCRDYDESFDIEKLELKKLVLHRCIFARSNRIRFKAPNLKVFKYCSPVPPLVSQVNVEAGTIEEAHLDLSPLKHFIECGYELQKLLQHFSAVNVLTVCSVILQVIHSEDAPRRLPEGLRVRHLKMKIQLHSQEWYGFLWFLNSCPWLTKLTIDVDRRNILPEYDDPYSSLDPRRFWERLIVPYCLRYSLMEVEVNGFRTTPHGFKACNYLISSALILRKLSINVFNDDADVVEKRRIIASRLLRITKASRDLVIIIH